MAVRLHLEGAVTYMQHIGLNQLEGICVAVDEKLKELDIQPGRRSLQVFETSGGHETTGNTAGIVRFVKSVTSDSSDEEKEQLKAIAAVIRNRYNNAGYKPKHHDH